MGIRLVIQTFTLINLIFCSSSMVFASDGFSILLTNDDGVESVGIKALSFALKRAGHTVTVIAPSRQQSGSGMKVSLNDIAVEEIKNDVWSVEGTPSDSVSVGIQQIMAGQEIDLVISGPNFGQNLGSNVFVSGTVGAAMTSLMYGVPSIALSVGINLEEASTMPSRFPSTLSSFAPAAEFLTSFLGQWRGRDLRTIFPSNSMININYPEIGKNNIKGVKWVEVGDLGGFKIGYFSRKSGKVPTSISENETVDLRARDLAMFNRGYITLSMLTLDWNTPKNRYHGISGSLRIDGYR